MQFRQFVGLFETSHCGQIAAYAALCAVDIDGDVVASRELVQVLGLVQHLGGVGVHAQLEVMADGSEAHFAFVPDSRPTHVHSVAVLLRAQIVVSHFFGGFVIDAHDGATRSVAIGLVLAFAVVGDAV